MQDGGLHAPHCPQEIQLLERARLRTNETREVRTGTAIREDESGARELEPVGYSAPTESDAALLRRSEALLDKGLGTRQEGVVQVENRPAVPARNRRHGYLQSNPESHLPTTSI
jgi:hypothetical protein